jgi:peptidoglycan-N-acetylglucosamine deacetylase
MTELTAKQPQLSAEPTPFLGTIPKQLPCNSPQSSSRMKKIWSIASALSGNIVRTRGNSAGGAVYLTFDDGPHPEHTARLLDLLAKFDAKGSFFMVGKTVAQAPDLVRRMLAEGHTIGNHSMTHPKMRTLGAAAQRREIEAADAVLERQDGRRRHPYRPPNGAVTLPMMTYSLWHRQPLVLWTIDSLDYKLAADQVIDRLTSVTPPRPGDVILFHDDGACAGRALEALLPVWKQAGLSFAAVS